MLQRTWFPSRWPYAIPDRGPARLPCTAAAAARSPPLSPRLLPGRPGPWIQCELHRQQQSHVRAPSISTHPWWPNRLLGPPDLWAAWVLAVVSRRGTTQSRSRYYYRRLLVDAVTFWSSTLTSHDDSSGADACGWEFLYRFSTHSYFVNSIKSFIL